MLRNVRMATRLLHDHGRVWMHIGHIDHLWRVVRTADAAVGRRLQVRRRRHERRAVGHVLLLLVVVHRHL